MIYMAGDPRDTAFLFPQPGFSIVRSEGQCCSCIGSSEEMVSDSN